MATCDMCGKSENMPYHCRHCGGTFCGEHRLPESHDCPGLEDWNDPSGIFESDFDDSVDNPGTRSSDGWLSGLIDTGTGGPLGYFRGNMTFVFLGLMFITFAAQWVVASLFNPQLYLTLFILRPTHVEYVWTWFTSIFAHNLTTGIPFHLLFNAIVIYFFGRLLEQYIGSRDFTLLFLGSGVLAGLGHVALELVRSGEPTGVLGASGAALAIMGVLTVLNPNLRVYLYAIIPIPIWVLTIGYAIISVSGIFGITIPFFAGVAHAAHLVGLVIGLAYGQRVKGQQNVPNRLQFGGGRGGGGMGGPGRGRGPF